MGPAPDRLRPVTAANLDRRAVFAGAVAGANVDDYDLDLTHDGATDAIHNGPDGVQFVVTRNHNRKREIFFIDH